MLIEHRHCLLSQYEERTLQFELTFKSSQPPSHQLSIALGTIQVFHQSRLES